MDMMTLYLLQILLCAILGGVFIRYLTKPLGQLFQESCATPAEALFWVKIIAVMVMIAPVIMVTIAGLYPPEAVTVAGELKRTLVFVLGTQFAGAALIARTVWKHR